MADFNLVIGWELDMMRSPGPPKGTTPEVLEDNRYLNLTELTKDDGNGPFSAEMHVMLEYPAFTKNSKRKKHDAHTASLDLPQIR